MRPDEGKALYCTWNNRIHTEEVGLGHIHYRYGPKPLDTPYLLTEKDYEDVDPIGENEIILDGVRYEVESKEYAYLKAFVVKLRYSNDDQIALMLNYQENPEAYREAYEEMQAWRDKAGFVAKHAEPSHEAQGGG